MVAHVFSLWCGVGGNTTYPKPEQITEMEQFVDQCARAGVTILHPTLIPDDYMPAFAVFGNVGFGATAPTAFDYYQLWNPWPLLIRKARRRGIETRPYLAINSHGWQMPKKDSLVKESFPYMLGQRFAVQHPEFWARNRAGQPIIEVTNSIILSLAYQEVRDHQTTHLCDLVRRYDLSGIQLEYVSEPLDGNGVAVTGYEDQMVSAFRSETGRDPFHLPNDDPEWLKFRASYTGLQVKELRAALNRVEKGAGRKVELSVSVFAREADEYLKLFQDWPTWVQNGWVDRVCLWHREADMDAIRRRTRHAAAVISGKGHLTSQISVYHPAAIHDAETLLDTARISLDSGADSLGVYRGDAVHVHSLWDAVTKIGQMY